MISIIIPVYNEQKTIGKLLEKIIAYRQVEIIVVDGESRDETADIAKKYPVKVVQTTKPRAHQCNAGAKESSGDILVFLHADCFIRKCALEEIKANIEKGFVGGCLRQKIDAKGFIYRCIEASGNIRAKIFKVFYGDQAIFVQRDTFFRLGGFEKLELFDDVAFSKKLKKQGKTCLLNNRVYTSSRRWEKQGIIKTTFINWLLTASFLLGVSPKTLKNIYYDIR